MANFDLIYLIVSVVISIFYGIFAEKIFLREKQYRELALCKKIRKFIIHFFGTAIGFSILYFLIKKAMFCLSTNQYNESMVDVLLLIIALLGVSGFIPDVAYKIKEGADNIVGKIIKS